MSRPTEDGGVWGSYVDYLERLERDFANERAACNRLARECADLRDEAATIRQQERERIADWFAQEGDLWRINNQTDEDHEYHRIADVIRDDIPSYPIVPNGDH